MAQKTCQECNGSGEVELESGDIETCENCEGEGYVETEKEDQP